MASLAATQLQRTAFVRQAVFRRSICIRCHRPKNLYLIPRTRHVATSSSSSSNQPSFAERLKKQWNATPIEWYSMPIWIGIGYLGFKQYQKVKTREQEKIYVESGGSLEDIQITGPWSVFVISTLPLRSISRIWGKVNEYTLPVWMRVPVYKTYSFLFGCNLGEMEEQNLEAYPNLAAFFYRSLKPGIRTVDNRADLVSPADGKVLDVGAIRGRRVHSVKGLSYSLDALFGRKGLTKPSSTHSEETSSRHTEQHLVSDREFADMNGIKYSLDKLLGTEEGESKKHIVNSDVSLGANDDASIDDERSMMDRMRDAGDQLLGTFGSVFTRTHKDLELDKGNGLFYAVIYLAPGDYHRFHSPANWVVELRRHFAGELFSVSPWMADRLANLFVLNERVVLLGRWKHGFFSMTPVGATNVGSIKINFDKALRTNTHEKHLRAGTFTQVTYHSASALLGGKPLRSGQEMGGFCLGSTIVLVFEAPKEKWKWDVREGLRVKVGEPLGHVETSS